MAHYGAGIAGSRSPGCSRTAGLFFVPGKVAAPGYQSVEQGFAVDMHTDTDYVLEIVLEPVEERAQL